MEGGVFQVNISDKSSGKRNRLIRRVGKKFRFPIFKAGRYEALSVLDNMIRLNKLSVFATEASCACIMFIFEQNT